MGRHRKTALLVAAALAAAGVLVPASPALALGELSLTFSGAPTRMIAGDTANLVVKVANDGALTATEGTMNVRPNWDPFESDAPNLSGPGCNGSLVPPTIICTLPALTPGSWMSIPVSATIPGTGEISLDIGATADAGDPPVTYTATPLSWRMTVEPKADVKLELSASPESVNPGGPSTVRALVTNTSAYGTAYGTTVKYSLPPEAQVVSKPDGCTGTALSLVCPAGNLAPLAKAEQRLVVTGAREGSLTILGAVLWDRPDTTPVDTQGQVNVSVVPPPDPDTTGGAPAAPTGPPKPVAATAASLARGLPASGGCFRKRRIALILRPRGVWDPVAATIRVTGRKRALVLKNSRAQAPFTLSLPRRGRVVLKLAVTYDSGRSYTATRTFRRCRAR